MASLRRSPNKIRNAIYAVGLLAVAGTFASAPLYFKYRNGAENLTLSDKPLSGNQIMRGAYINSGSKDVGRDPDWVNGRYVGKAIHTFNPTEEDIAAHRIEMEARRKASMK